MCLHFRRFSLWKFGLVPFLIADYTILQGRVTYAPGDRIADKQVHNKAEPIVHKASVSGSVVHVLASDISRHQSHGGKCLMEMIIGIWLKLSDYQQPSLA